MRARRVSAAAITGTLMFLVGAFIFLSPGFDVLRLQRGYGRELESFLGRDSLALQEDAAPDAAETVPDDDAYRFLLDYNERVIAGTAGVVNDPWGIGSDTDVLESVGIRDAVVGVLRVERLNLEVPIFLGASYDHMERGCAIISGTSAPLGQPTSNVVIAGHRGTLFRDIEDIQPGDTLTIETRWETLSYRAVESRIISPNDAEAIAIQNGHDIVTVLTCHPYGYSLQRYLVFFERVQPGSAGGTGELDGGGFDSLAPFSPVRAISEALAPCDSIQLRAERWLRVAGFALLVLIPTLRLLTVCRPRRHKRVAAHSAERRRQSG